jgi:hypothetical protein
MKLWRFAGMTVLAASLSALVFFAGPPVAGQAQDVPRNNFYPLQGGNVPYLDNQFHLEFAPGAKDPEMQKLLGEEAKSEREADGLLKEYAHKENASDRAKIKAKLTEVLGKQFDAQQARRDVELARLETQVKKLRELMKKRSDARQTIVDKRLDQLISAAEGLGWNTSPGLPRTDVLTVPRYSVQTK